MDMVGYGLGWMDKEGMEEGWKKKKTAGQTDGKKDKHTSKKKDWHTDEQKDLNKQIGRKEEKQTKYLTGNRPNTGRQNIVR